MMTSISPPAVVYPIIVRGSTSVSAASKKGASTFQSPAMFTRYLKDGSLWCRPLVAEEIFDDVSPPEPETASEAAGREVLITESEKKRSGSTTVAVRNNPTWWESWKTSVVRVVERFGIHAGQTTGVLLKEPLTALSRSPVFETGEVQLVHQVDMEQVREVLGYAGLFVLGTQLSGAAIRRLIRPSRSLDCCDRHRLQQDTSTHQSSSFL
eukprot:ANDGO_04796.mRNA.1 hypothetical protein